MASEKLYTGINVQYPISQSIVSGKKVIETRTYPIPAKYLNTDLLLVETPGKDGLFEARITAIIKFTECKQYRNSSEFYRDSPRHLVKKGSKWAWSTKPKFGWTVEVVKKISPPRTLCGIKKGIVYTNGITL